MSKSMLFLCVETPLHAGSGRSLGTVDLPIQRERTTGYPMIQSSGVKGRLRAEMQPKLPKDEWLAIFGPEQDSTEPGKTPADFAGALSFGDARLLLFPVRSLAGVFAWCTSVDALARFLREMEMIGQKPGWDVPAGEPQEAEAWINGNALIAGDKVVLEEFSFTPLEKPEVKTIGEWLAANALPALPEYSYWKNSLPSKLCILPKDAFRDFTLYATEVQTHIKLNPDKKTVESGALWTAESLPVDTVLYAPLMANRPRSDSDAVKGWDEKKVLQKITQANLNRINFGGDETTGQGFVALKFLGGEA